MNIARTTLRGVTYYNPFKASQGYTLFSVWGQAASIFDNSEANGAWLIDMEGHIVNCWRLPRKAGLHGMLLPNGNLIYPGTIKNFIEIGVPREFAGFGGMFMEVDWDGNILWQAEAPLQSHSFLPLPNGHIMYPAYTNPKGIVPEEIAAKWRGGVPGTGYKGKIYGDILQEIDRDGNIVWEWIGYEHLDPEIDAFCIGENRTQFHINSLWLCRNGNILISPRHLSVVWRIEYPSGKVIARYGKGKIFHQHDARELDNGNILIFDNGSHRPSMEPTYSRSVEIDPDTDEIVWEYKANFPADFYSPTMGGSERVPNGNTVICESTLGRVFEVTREGELVWEYVNPIMGSMKGSASNKLFRAHRYPVDYRGLNGKDLDPSRFPWGNRLYGPAGFRKDFAPIIF